jgi:hypothetical protein
MIDLAGVIRNYDTETESKGYVEKWIEEAKEIYRQTESFVLYGKRRLKKTLRFREFSLGKPEAENDEGLIECFTVTPFYERAKRFEKWLFLGRRGSGKTAIFMKLAEELKEKLSNHLVLLEPTDLQFVVLKEFLKDEFAKVHSKFLFRSIWRYIILTECIKSLYENPPKAFTSEELAPVIQFVNEKISDIKMDFVDRLKNKIKELEKEFLHVTKDSEKTEILKRILSVILLKDVTSYLKELFKKYSTVMLIDKIDSSWNIKKHESILLLNGLIQEVHKINLEFGGGLRVLMFLREDIYDVLRKYDEDLDKKEKSVINWSKENLIEFIGRRIETSLGSSASFLMENEWKAIWENIFPNLVDNKHVTDFIIDRSLMRPRDVLIFCKKALEFAQDRNHSKIELKDVLDSENEYSIDRLDNLGTEYIVNYPGLSDFLLDSFSGTTSTIREDELISRINNYILKGGSYRAWDEIKEWLVPEFEENNTIRILFDIGFMGIKQKDGSISYSYDKNYSSAERTASGEEVIITQKKKIAILFTKKSSIPTIYKFFVIHPAFRKVLESN